MRRSLGMLLAGCVAVGIATAAWAAHSGALVAKPQPGTMKSERMSVYNPPTMDAVVVIRTGGGGTGTGFSVYNGTIGGSTIVTAAHVVGKAKTVSIKDVDGNIRMATVDIVDAATDLAILSTQHRIPAAELDCRLAKVGDAIESIGTPLGLEFITATGRIAGTARKVGGTNVLVTDIVTVMGMSGGAVFSKGRVVGVTHAVMIAPLNGPMGQVPSLAGFGFIIPSSDVCALLDGQEPRYYRLPYSDETAKALQDAAYAAEEGGEVVMNNSGEGQPGFSERMPAEPPAKAPEQPVIGG